MQPAEVEKFLAQGLERMELHPGNQDKILSLLTVYFQELKKWNRKVNLVGRKQVDRVILENHFLDSLTLLPLLEQEQMKTAKLLDIGTGAGFPGLVLKTAMPRLRMVLVEPRQNRYYFLKHMIRTLQLDGVGLLQVRLKRNNQPQELLKQKFSIVTSRAVSDIETLVEISSELLDFGGRIVCMKGPRGVEEVEKFQQHGLSKDFTVGLEKALLPFSRAERNLIILKKV